MPFTPDSELELLFSPSLISPDVKAALHKDLHVRLKCSIFPDHRLTHYSI